MKNILSSRVVFVSLVFSIFAGTAHAGDGYVDLNLEGLHSLSTRERAQDPCYQLAAEGEFVENDDRQMGFPHVWVPGTHTTWRWRVTEFSSGMKCEVLVSGNDAQSNARKVGCRCNGRLHVE